MVVGNSKQRTNLDIQEPNNVHLVENQCIVSEAPALNNIPPLYVKYKITVPLETNTQSTHYKVLLSYDIN